MRPSIMQLTSYIQDVTNTFHFKGKKDIDLHPGKKANKETLNTNTSTTETVCQTRAATIERKLYDNYFEAETSNIFSFELLKCKDFLLFFVFSDSK